MATMQNSFDPQYYCVIHPLDDAPEENAPPKASGTLP